MTEAYTRFRPIGISRKRFSRTRLEIAQALFERGLSQFRAGRHRRARVYFERLATLMPESAQAHYLLGLTYKAMGNDELARTSWQEAVRLPDYEDANTEAKQMAQKLLDRQT